MYLLLVTVAINSHQVTKPYKRWPLNVSIQTTHPPSLLNMPSSPFDFFDKNGYENHFCACFKDPICCLGAWCCLPCTVGKLKGDLDDKTFDLWSCLCFPIGAYRIRRRVNELYNKTESEDGSMCAIGCCHCCAVAQDGHEIRVHRKAATEAAAVEAGTAPASNTPPTRTEAPTA